MYRTVEAYPIVQLMLDYITRSGSSLYIYLQYPIIDY